MRRAGLLLLVALLFSSAAAQEGARRSLREQTKDLQKLEGFFPVYWDSERGRLLLEIARFNQEFLYQTSLQTGVGSNPVGLDRGQLGATHVVHFERIGPKVLLVEPNQRYRARSNDPLERRSVEESFARSVLWGFKVEAEAADGDRVLVDATAFFMRDAHGVSDRLRRAQQGSFTLDESRSALHMPRTKNFPLNTEVEALLTFNSNDPGPLVRQTTPWPQNLTVRQHHSLVQLPDSEYRPRRYDPRVGLITTDFYDYATPLTEPIEQRWIIRHRLVKRDPAAAVSEPVKPIVYYVDPGAPEPIRSALVEGASWWNEAFEAAGFRNAFQVKVLPSDADPMDIRYNMINWVHRSTRGWSIGDTVVDPRTGEIIKGNVTLDSLRARQDYLLGVGLVPQFEGGARGAAPRGRACDFGAAADDDYLLAFADGADAAQMTLARIRQLSAHEVGHTLGLEHNFAASTYAGRASVMDYPAPLVEIKNGKLDLSNAYGRGIGVYDKFAVTYAYAQVAPGADENGALARIVEDGVAAGMLYLTDRDARPAGAAHPLANLWDNGGDPVQMLRHEMEVRRIGLSQFGLGSIATGTPLSMLEAKLLPLYLHHRYQLQAAVKTVGGLYYTYSVKTAAAAGAQRLDGASPRPVQQIVPAAKQRDALSAVLDTLRPDALAIPPRILELVPPRAPGFEGGTIELFQGRTDPAFDPVGVASIAADLAVSALLEPHRAARLVDYHSRDPANPPFREVVAGLMQRTWLQPAPQNAYQAEIARAVQSLVATRLMDLAANDAAPAQVRATATEALRELAGRLKAPAGMTGAEELAHRRAALDDIERFLARPDAPRKRTAPLPAPPGDPIGQPAQRN